MGYTSGHPCMFSLEMKQSPQTVRKVLDIAGWTSVEAAKEIDVSYIGFADVVEGRRSLSTDKWRLLLEKAGSRAFDHDEDAE